MQTKCFYDDGTWQAIIEHPKFDLGKRELVASIRFLPMVTGYATNIPNMLHLGVGNGREISFFINNLPNLKNYFVNDICAPTLREVFAAARKQFPTINFIRAQADIELTGAISFLRRQIKGPALISLIANGVIFSNRQMDIYISAEL